MAAISKSKRRSIARDTHFPVYFRVHVFWPEDRVTTVENLRSQPEAEELARAYVEQYGAERAHVERVTPVSAFIRQEALTDG